ncbi:MAG TPA: SH3 domain-containing protein [Thermomicrobiales bacterium]|nr:SH3 domain-containing protein [Thermomicrobiales bacterium]
MTQISRRRLLAAASGLGLAMTSTVRAGASSTTQLPVWGESEGATDLQGGPLGLNLASDPGQVPVSIRIPDADVDAEIERQQIVDGQMLDPTGPWVVAWYEQSARAGQIGNWLGSGHVDYWDVGPSVFRNVASIPEGAPIDVTGKGGVVYTYEVEYIRQIELATVTVDELNSPELVGRTDYAAISLITCGGTFDYDAGEYLYRDLIRGRLISSTRPEAPADSSGDTGDTQSQDTGGTSATVNTDNVNLRSEPSTSAEIVRVLASGTVVTITGENQDAEGYTWSPIALEDGTTGWVVVDFLTAS